MLPQLPAKSAYALMAGFAFEKQRCKTRIVSPLSAAELLQVEGSSDFSRLERLKSSLPQVLATLNSISLNCLKPTTIRRELSKPDH
jgi:uncharacterized protein YjfI (DUF2170 family)